MERYKLIPKDKKIFSRLTEDFAAREKFLNCYLNEVIVTPEIKLWKIRLQTDENLDAELLRDAEVFLSEKFDSDIKIEVKISAPTEKNFLPPKNIPAPPKPPEEKILPPKNISAPPKPAENKNLNGDKIFGKKISGEITDITNLIVEKKSVICGEIGSGEKNGVNFRHLKRPSDTKFSCYGAFDVL